MITYVLFALQITSVEPADECWAKLDTALAMMVNESDLEGGDDLPKGAEAVLDRIRTVREAKSLEVLQSASKGYDAAAMRFSRAKNKECPRRIRERFLKKTDDLMYELELDTIREMLARMLARVREGMHVSVSTELGELPMFLGTAWERELSEAFALVSSLADEATLAYAEEARARIIELARDRECVRGTSTGGSSTREAQTGCAAELDARKAYPEGLEMLAPTFEAHLKGMEHAVSSTVLIRGFDAAKRGRASYVEWADPRFNELMALVVVLRDDERSGEKLTVARQRLYPALRDWRETDVYGEVGGRVDSYLNGVEMQQRRYGGDSIVPLPVSSKEVKRRRRLVAGWVGSSVLAVGGVSGLAVIEGMRSNGWHDAEGRDRQLELSRWGPVTMGASIAALTVGAVALIATTVNDCARQHVICRRKRESVPERTKRNVSALPGGVLVRF